MHEVMSGSFFTPQRESVPEQTWSSSAFLSAAIHGMLGLESDARTNVLQLEPQVPASWHSFQIEHIRIGSSIVDLEWHADNGHFTLDLKNSGAMFHLKWTQAGTGGDANRSVTLERDIMPGNTHLTMH
jgi:cellobiose phosphorylase